MESTPGRGNATVSPTVISPTSFSSATIRADLANEAISVTPTLAALATDTPLALPGLGTCGDTTVPPPVYGLTHQRPDGNRLLAGKGSMPASLRIDAPLGGVPLWIVGVPDGEDSIWVAALADGTVRAFRVHGGVVQQAQVNPSALPAGMPPLFCLSDGEASLITAKDASASLLTHPLPVGDALLTISKAGDIVLDGAGGGRLPADALPDARLVTNSAGQFGAFGGATDQRYKHAVLGDGLEATRLLIFETMPRLRLLKSVELAEPDVFEGLSPIWADLDGGGNSELITTVSNAQTGARIVVFGSDGRRIAEGPSFERGGRWRHQLAVAPFAPDGTPELAVMRTPHIGGVIEFYRLIKSELRLVASVPGYTSHVLGSRNLDMAVAGDFNGDGQPELVVPDQGRTSLVGIRRTNAGAEEAWRTEVGGTISTNLAGVTLPDGHLLLGVGRDDGTLRLWIGK